MEKIDYIGYIPPTPKILHVYDINSIDSFLLFFETAINQHPFLMLFLIIFGILTIWKVGNYAEKVGKEYTNLHFQKYYNNGGDK